MAKRSSSKRMKELKNFSFRSVHSGYEFFLPARYKQLDLIGKKKEF